MVFGATSLILNTDNIQFRTYKYKILKILVLKQKLQNTDKKKSTGQDRTRTRKGPGPIQERVQYQDKGGSIPGSLLPTQEVSL